jgi:uncharacterized protein YgiM (DUF1202 family)
MKKNCWLILGTMLATTAVAQVNSNKLPEIPAPAATAAAAPAAAAPTPVVAPAEVSTNAPAKKIVKAKKKGPKKTKSATKTAAKAGEKKAVSAPVLPVTLVAGPATVAADNVNLRGQAGLQGEVVGHVKKGDAVTVLAEINLDKPKTGEPAQWAKIALPTNSKVWINSKFVDSTNKVVSVKKLNLRGGPGENFSVLGVVEKGTAVNSVTTKGDWIQIETPASAYAFVAASFLKQEGAGVDTNVPPPVATATPPVPPTPTTVAEAPVIAPPAATPPPAIEPAAPAPVPAAPALAATTPATPPSLVPTPTLAPDTDTNLPPPPPRIISHEGFVRPSVSLVAPTYFELYDPANNKAINYLYSTTTNLNLGRYNGMHIIVTGEEGMDVRWRDTPVLTIQKINVLAADPAKGKPAHAGK